MVKSVGVKQKGEKKVKIISAMGRISGSSEHHDSEFVTKQGIIPADCVLLQNLYLHALVPYEVNPDIFWQKIYFDRITVGMSNLTGASHSAVHVRHL